MFENIPCEVIDCHIHPPFPSTRDTSWFLPVKSSEAFWADMKNAGVDRACGAPIERMDPQTWEEVAALNHDALLFYSEFPDKYIPAIHIDPRYPDESCHELETYYHKHGVRWIGELVGYMMGYGGEYMPAGCESIYDLAGELGVPVNFHCSELEMIAALCTRFPKTKFVLAHPEAGRQPFKDRLAVVKAHANLYLDLAGSGIMRWGMVRHIIDEAGEDKPMLGSDFPICSIAQYVAGILAEPLSDQERESVLSANFKRLTGLQ